MQELKSANPRWISRYIGPCLINCWKLFTQTGGTAMTRTGSELVHAQQAVVSVALHYPLSEQQGNSSVCDSTNLCFHVLKKVAFIKI